MDEAQAAKDKLERAITEYYNTVEPNIYMSAWVLVAHKVPFEGENVGQSAVSYLVPTGQYWPHTAGYLQAAADSARGLA